MAFDQCGSERNLLYLTVAYNQQSRNQYVASFPHQEFEVCLNVIILELYCLLVYGILESLKLTVSTTILRKGDILKITKVGNFNQKSKSKIQTLFL